MSRRMMGWLLLLSTLAAGCAAERSPSQGAADRAMTKVRVVAQPHLSSAPILIALEEGYFREQGLDVEVLSFPASRPALPALVRGDLEVLSGSSPTTYLNAIARGARIRMVADRGHFAPDGCTYMALVTRPELLVQGRLGPLGTPRRWILSARRDFELAAIRGLGAYGIEAEDLEIHHLPRHVELQSLVRGDIDFAVASGTSLSRLLASETVEVLKPGQEILPEGQLAVVLFGPRLLDDDPETGVRFIAAYLRGVRQYQEGKTERNLELLLRGQRWSREELLETCWVAVREDGRVDLQSLLEYQRWAVPRGLLSRVLEAEEIWEPRFVEEALRRLADDRHRDGGTRRLEEVGLVPVPAKWRVPSTLESEEPYVYKPSKIPRD